MAFARTLILAPAVALFCLVMAAPAESAESSGGHAKFLGSRTNHLSHQSVVEFDLLQELEKVAGRDNRLAAEQRVDRLEGALKPMFLAMANPATGKIDATGARYLLHRLFVQRHGWIVNGLDNAGEAWNSSSPAAVFQDHAAEHHDLFQDKLRQSFDLHQVAVFAAALEALVHTESIGRLEAVYRVLGLTKSESLTDVESAEVIRSYMVMYVSAANISSITSKTFKVMSDSVLEMYPTFPDTEDFVREVRSRVLEDVPSSERNTWQATLKVVEEIGERYGHWQDKECHVLKDMLVKREVAGTGRVPLQDFYGPALTNESWQFLESVPYLRQLGALDETDSSHPSVIIPNYLNSPTNCVGSSKFYSVCCIDQCESIVVQLEREVGAAPATPERVAEIVAGLRSETVQAPRVLPPTLLARLQEIAARHGGVVRLHSRLFAQWLHHAYPRECSYPHISGTTRPLTQEQLIEEQGVDAVQATEEDIQAIVNLASASGSGALAVQELPWSSEDEIFSGHHDLFEPRHGGSSYTGRGMMLIAAPVVVVLMILKFYEPGKPKGLPVDAVANHKYFV